VTVNRKNKDKTTVAVIIFLNFTINSFNVGSFP
jgi:hypothetical protein